MNKAEQNYGRMKTIAAGIKQNSTGPRQSCRDRGIGLPGTLALFLAIFFFSCPVFADGPGSTGVQVLKTDISPRAMGMGGAFAAIADDLYSINYNPAGLGQLYMPEVSAMYLSGFEDSGLNNFAVAMPLPLTGFADLAKPAVGLSFMMADAGSFNLRLLNANGTITESSYDAQKDMVVALGYGEKVYSDELKIEGYALKLDQYLGFNVKYIKSTLLEDYTASAIAFDAGWLGMAPNLGLSAAVSMANVGGGLKYLNETTRLPSILRIGLSYQRPTIMDQSVLIAAEGDFYTAESQKSLRVGMEYHFEQFFNMRVGYKALEDNGGLTMGLGVRYDDMSLDFATSAGGEVYNTSQLSFSYKFSGIVVKEHRKKTVYKDPRPQDKTPQKPARPKPASKPAAPRDNKDKSDFIWLY
ncbi:MAG: hypothetical protein A2234_05310 [Elusimicrobia bacterium RIFOXYA2_FULL_58_8]|nr:MAG: hypothetical protein A2285_01970 [Elusimicrobia bacterium RIFOXYA12_FULL_57_11]OGS15886.1 MAG: hypothetical protein A2234_05310 [Elusimicrobia bacterium RIFOXYA2_FULL_58_8]